MDYRGAVVEDLQLPPPLPVYSSQLLVDARDLVLEQAPWIPRVVGVLDPHTRRLGGYLEGSELESESSETDLVAQHMCHLERPVQVSILTPLERLAELLALVPVVEVVDASRVHVLAVATAHDVERRGMVLPTRT